MKKRNLWLVMLALVLVFGMLFVACGGEEGEPADGDGDEEEDLVDPEDIVPAEYLGTYTVTYPITGGNQVETIAFTKNTFNISDDTKKTDGTSANSHLHFTITDWDDTVTTPATYATDFPKAFKFTGKIVEATADYVPSMKTAPDFVLATDVKSDGTGPDCWMFLYISADGKKFVRSAFSKTGKDNKADPIKNNADSKDRVYTKS